MVEHQDTLYVFGGELSFCNDQETPLWMYDIKVNLRYFGLDMSFILSLNGWVDWVYILSQPGFSQCSKVKIRIDILELEKV